MYFDSHAHLDDARFEADFDEILAHMRENGVTAMMNIGCDLPSSENVPVGLGGGRQPSGRCGPCERGSHCGVPEDV